MSIGKMQSFDPLLVDQLYFQNYLSWSRSTDIAFDAENKLCFIDGSTDIPPLLELNRFQ